MVEAEGVISKTLAVVAAAAAAEYFTLHHLMLLREIILSRSEQAAEVMPMVIIQYLVH